MKTNISFSKRPAYSLTLILLFLNVTFALSQNFKKVIGVPSPQVNIIGWSVAPMENGDLVFTGQSGPYGSGQGDVFIMRTNQLGAVKFYKTFGGTKIDIGYSIKQTSDKGFIVSGITQSSGAGDSDILLMKTDSLGNLLWAKTYGGSVSDFANSVIQTKDNGFVLTGMTCSFGGACDIFVLKTDGNGNLVWANNYGSSTSDENARCIVDLDGKGFVISGNTAGFGAGNRDIYILKIDPSGNLQWSKTIGGPDFEFGEEIIYTKAKKLLFTGRTTGFTASGTDIVLGELDTLGTLNWFNTYGSDLVKTNGQDQGYSLVETNDNNIAIFGQTYSPQKAMVLKTSMTGQVIWNKIFSGTFLARGNSGTQTTQGHLASCGEHYATSTSMSNILFAGTQNSTVITNCDSTFIMSVIYTGPATIGAAPTIVTSSISFVVSNAPLVALTHTLVTDNAVCSYSDPNLPTSVTDEIQEQSYGFTLYPNPGSGIYNLRFNSEHQNRKILIRDILGKVVLQEQVSEPKHTITLPAGANGLYFLSVLQGGENVKTVKLLKDK